MIEAVVAPFLLVAVAALAGWRSGHRVSSSVWRALRRARAAWRLLCNRSPLCDPCRRRLASSGTTAVLCDRCDPVLVTLLSDARFPRGATDHPWGWSRDT